MERLDLKTITQPAIYCLSDPNTDQIRYIGQSVNPYMRAGRYLTANVKSQPHLGNWLKKLKHNGQRCRIHILTLTETAEQLNDEEVRWIAEGKTRGWNLINHTDGGDARGRKLNEEELQAMRERGKKLRSNPELVAKNTKALQTAIAAQQVEREQRKIERQQQAQARQAEQQKQREEKTAKRYALTYKGRAFIPLTNGKHAVVSVEDADRVMEHTWHAQRKTNSGCAREYWRAMRNLDGYGDKQLLNRFVVVEAKDKQAVRHLDGNQLNCCRDNLSVR
jgi:hypothetical protein